MRRKIKVLVVDDSAFVTAAISRALKADSEIEVVGVAHDGIEAVEKVSKLLPDVVTLDVIMPRMDGLTALELIMSECPTPVVMLSALTDEGAEATIKALELGAVDFYLKALPTRPLTNTNTAMTLADKVKLAAKANISRRKVPVVREKSGDRKRAHLRVSRVEPGIVVVVGSSTGGPRSLMQFIPALPADIPVALIVVQHMPPLFTRSLAERLDQASQIQVKEADAGDRIAAGQALVAPGDYHLLVGKRGKIRLSQGPSVWGVRPSIDVTMESVAKAYGPSSMGVVLTGMGVDGTRGASLIKAAGGRVYVEDESTCAVYGMPMSILKAGYADRAVPVYEMASVIVETLRDAQRNHSEVLVTP